MSCPKTGNPLEGNPCNPATGNKSQTEIDYASANGTLKVQRYYHSQGIGDGFSDLGLRWRHNYAQTVDGYREPDYARYRGAKSPFYLSPSEACVDGWNTLKNKTYNGLLSDGLAIYRDGACEIQHGDNSVAILPIHNNYTGRKDVSTTVSIRSFSRPNGDIFTFRLLNSQWQPLHPVRAAMMQNGTGWTLTTPNGSTEVYNSEGKLHTTTSSEGQVTNFTYDEEDRLSVVTGHFGDTLTYHYDEDSYLITITTPDGDLGYGYDTYGRLTNVTYPDTRQRHYHYEEGILPYHLTGITDENGDRYATWAYDAKGRAILSEHANSTERVEFAYNGDDTTTVTDAAGAERTYHFEVNQGAMKVSHIEGDRCTTCSNGGTKAYTYDSNGFVSSKTDWNNNVTTYTRDAQGRELSQTEASGTPEARTITTTWDTVLNKPLVITEPEQITEYTYDASGRILNQQQRPHP
ncbi:MAG: hypothetical protein KZQ82_07130 [Candidatus Thiodiazotropha sp. (ex Lucinoma annulata)]|nr:hypothetical protein [Candidatus Thiodiazotropha sp. (ex Lucinoma annulata)]